MAETTQTVKSFTAKHRYARITARKARLVADLIRGRPVNQALELLQYEHKRAASFYVGVVRSAMANASQDEGVDVNALVVSDARADDGPMLQGRMRFRPGPQGRAHPFKKLTSHLTVVVTEQEGEKRARKASKKSSKKKAPAKQSNAKQAAESKE